MFLASRERFLLHDRSAEAGAIACNQIVIYDCIRVKNNRITNPMHRPRYLPFALAAIAIAVACPTAWAFSMVLPYSYKKLSPTGEYVFVMIVGRDYEPLWLGTTKTSENRGTLRTYPRSGMYRNDDSNDPLWTVDWYAYHVEMALDGVHVLRWGWWTMTPDSVVFGFYANGQLLREFRLNELETTPRRFPECTETDSSLTG